MKKTLMLLSAAALCTSGFAQWDEIANGGGDAGDLPGTAQVTMGVGALTMITGDHPANDVDMFAINIVSPGSFSASTIGLTTMDTQLFLFDSTGMGVTMDDDDPSGVGGFQSIITGVFVSAPGLYYLAISNYNADPSSVGGLIWNNTPFDVERAPDGPGAGSPVISWSVSGGTVATYGIALTGAEYGAVPEPATFAVLGLGLVGLAALRRRK